MQIYKPEDSFGKTAQFRTLIHEAQPLRAKHRSLTLFRHLIQALVLLIWIALLIHIVRENYWVYIALGGCLLLYIIQRRRKELYYRVTDRIGYDFRIMKSDQRSRKRRLLNKIIDIIFWLIILSFPFLSGHYSAYINNQYEEMNFFLQAGFLLFIVISIYIGSSDKDYEYYLFHDLVIIEPGFPSKWIEWSDISSLRLTQNKKEFFFEMKNGKSIRFDLDDTSTPKPDAILAYIKERVHP